MNREKYEDIEYDITVAIAEPIPPIFGIRMRLRIILTIAPLICVTKENGNIFSITSHLLNTALMKTNKLAHM